MRASKNQFVHVVGSLACLVAILVTLGGHWLVFQSFAWATMIVNYSHDGPLSWAISRTFDGRHPCTMCVSIEQGRQREQAENKELPSVQPDRTPTLCCAPSRIVVPLPPVDAAAVVPYVPGWHSDHREPPPTPPPRPA